MSMNTGAGAEARIDAVKAGTAWAGVGAASAVDGAAQAAGAFDWTQLASQLAAFYTLLLILQWLWRYIIRPFAENRGWIKRRRRRATDRRDDDTGPGGL